MSRIKYEEKCKRKKRTKDGWMQKCLAVVLAVVLSAGMTGCEGKGKDQSEPQQEPETSDEAVRTAEEDDGAVQSGEESGGSKTSAEETEIQVFIAASLNTVMTDLAKRYQEIHPEVKIVFNADSSGTLLTQIQEGYECDIFFSAAQKQMDTLEEDGLVKEGSRKNVVNNQVVVLTCKDSGTKVQGLLSLKDAGSIALAGGSVPVGKYTRQALVNLGICTETEDVSKITTQEVSNALGGVEISEMDNVSKVLIAVAEGACEVGTTYYSDTYGYEEQVEILERVGYELTGDVIYPICLVRNPKAEEAQARAAEEFLNYVVSAEAKEVFASYYFDTDVTP